MGSENFQMLSAIISPKLLENKFTPGILAGEYNNRVRQNLNSIVLIHENMMDIGFILSIWLRILFVGIGGGISYMKLVVTITIVIFYLNQELAHNVIHYDFKILTLQCLQQVV